jgi:hypothetical protein
VGNVPGVASRAGWGLLIHSQSRIDRLTCRTAFECFNPEGTIAERHRPLAG